MGAFERKRGGKAVDKLEHLLAVDKAGADGGGGGAEGDDGRGGIASGGDSDTMGYAGTGVLEDVAGRRSQKYVLGGTHFRAPRRVRRVHQCAQ